MNSTVPQLLRQIAAALREKQAQVTMTKREKCAQLLKASVSLARLKQIIDGGADVGRSN